jgi:hypothetical protein
MNPIHPKASDAIINCSRIGENRRSCCNFWSHERAESVLVLSGITIAKHSPVSRHMAPKIYQSSSTYIRPRLYLRLKIWDSSHSTVRTGPPIVQIVLLRWWLDIFRTCRYIFRVNLWSDLVCPAASMTPIQHRRQKRNLRGLKIGLCSFDLCRPENHVFSAGLKVPL